MKFKNKNSRLKIAALDLAVVSNFTDILEKVAKNISKFDKVLNYVLCGRTLDWLHQYNDKSQDLFSMYRFYKLGYHVPFLELLEAIQYEVEEKFGQSVKTIGDLGWKNK